MSELDKLLEGADVEWKPLGEVCDFKNGFAFKSRLFKEEGLPIIRITNIDGRNIDLTDVKFFNNEDYKNSNISSFIIEKGDVLIAMSGATTGKIGYYNSIVPAYLNQRVGKFEPNKGILNTRYLYHFLLTKAEFIYILAGGGAQPNLSSNKLKEKLEIPIPCPENPEKSLQIQQKIVAILDTFTELTAELTAELTGRKQQYSFYREELLSFEEGEVEWKTLGEVMKVQRGKRLVRSQLSEIGNFAVYQNSMIPLGYYHENNVKSDTTFIICAGAAGEIGYSDNEFWAADDVSYLITPDNIKNKFVYYYLLTQKHKISSQVRRASIPRLSKKVLENMPIPIPPLEEQERIVSILDKFDTLTNSISEGLPKEIELRKKQYEYYRNQLLAFND